MEPLIKRHAGQLEFPTHGVVETPSRNLPLVQDQSTAKHSPAKQSRRVPSTPPGPVAVDLIALLRAELERLKREKHDLEIAFLNSNEHNDYLQDHLYRIGTSLAAEVRERQIAESKLHQVLQQLAEENVDLGILVQILIDQGDASAEEGAQARIDGLTQVANRRRFDEYLSQEWGRHRRAQQPISLLICDVDYFKLFNDTYGHQAGDDCLKAVASAMRQCVRRNGDMVARYGGEEFAMVLPETNLEGAVQVANRVRSALARIAVPHAASPVCGIVTLSVGAACKTPHPQAAHPQELIQEADQFLYLAKHHGRNRVGHRHWESFTDDHE